MENPIFTITDKVLSGNKRGSELGFPTINMQLTIEIPEGIYISQTRIQENNYNSITFIGAAKTFNESKKLIETNIFDFSQNVYDAVATVYLLKKIRDNIKFSSVNELIEQMNKDKKEAMQYFEGK